MSISCRHRGLVFSALFPVLAGVLYGYGISAPSGALGSPTSDNHTHPQLIRLFKMSTIQQEMFTSLPMVGALIGSIIVFNIGDRVGRRGALIIAALAYIIGSLFVMLTPLSRNMIFMLYFGQGFYGIGIGFTLHSAPLYIAEISTPDIRGLLVSMKEQGVVTGIMLGFLISMFMKDISHGWRYIYLSSLCMGCFLLFGMLRAPESPRLLVLQNLHQRRESGEMAPLLETHANARRVLERLRKGYSQEDVERELMEIDESLKSLPVCSFRDLFRGATKRALFIGCMLVFFQQATGQPSVLGYAPEIFRTAGFHKQAPIFATLLGVFKIPVNILAMFKADSVGRRPLLLGGIAGMLFSLTCLSVGFFVNSSGHDIYNFTDDWTIATLLLMICYSGFYQFSFGPVVMIISGEIYPLHTRSRAQSVSVLVNFLMNSIVSMSYLSLSEAVTISGALFIYGVMAFFALLFVYFHVPETRNCSLEEIQDMFERHSMDSNSSEYSKIVERNA